MNISLSPVSCSCKLTEFEEGELMGTSNLVELVGQRHRWRPGLAIGV